MINFSQAHRVGIFFFVALFGLFIGTFIYKSRLRSSAFVYSVDFTGGTQILVRFEHPTASPAVHKALEAQGLLNPTLREFSDKEVLIRLSEDTNSITNTAEKVKQALKSELAASAGIIEVLQVDSVGAGIGASLWWNTVMGLFFAFAVMLLYILSRFWSFGFALGTIGSLLHDVLLIVTLCLVFDIEISTNVVIVVLTILGYSINDTIIIFSRIRENMASLSSNRYSLQEIVNISINETLRRTLLTTISTLLAILPAMFLGIESISMLAILLFVGFVFGTYSSICVASPLMLAYSNAKARAHRL